MSADIGIVLGSLLTPADEHGGTHSPQGDLIFGNAVNAHHDLVLDGGGDLVFEDGLVVEGDLVLTNATSVTFKGNVEVTGRVIIDAGSILFGDQFKAGSTVALTSDEVDFLGGASSANITGDLTIKAHTAGFATQVGFTADAADSLGLTDSDIAALKLGGKLAIGDKGAVVVDSAEFSNEVSISGSDVTVQHGLLAGGARVALAADGVVRNDGVIDVSARSASSQAGTVILTGKYAGNFGTILARGGDLTSGGSVSMISTTQTLVGSTAWIDASGGTSGGDIYLWSDTNTTMAGTLAARGGQAGGNGGFVEVSSAGGFSLTGGVDTTAVAGKTGRLLLDPKNVIITGAVAPGTLVAVDAFSDTPADDVTISATTITGALSAVTIQANNDITVNAALNMSQDLTLLAGRSVLLNQSISLGNKSLTIIANDDAGINANRDTGDGSITAVHGVTLSAGSGTINLTVENGDVGPAGGITIDKVTISGILNITTAGYLHETAGDAAPASGSMTSDDDLTAGTLNLVVTSTGASVGEPLDTANGAIEIAAGTINADVQLLAGAPKTDFTGHFILTDADHTTAPMTIGTINAGSGAVVLTAKGGSILAGAGVTPNITAAQINLTTEKFIGPDLDGNNQPVPHYGSIGTSGAALRTDIGALTATSADGGLFISEANGLMLNKIIVQDKGVTAQPGANGTVVVTPAGQSATNGTSDARITAGGDVVVVDVKVADQFEISTTGMILDGNQDDANILARGLKLTSGGAIGDTADLLETSVMTLQATTTNGGVFIAESDGATVSSIVAGGTGNDVTLNSASGTLVLGEITAMGGDVQISAQAEGITDGNAGTANITAATANLLASTHIGTSADGIELNVSGLTTKVTKASAATYVANTGTLNALSIETNNGAVGFTLNGGSVAFVQPGTTNQLSLAAPNIGTFSFSNTGGSVAINNINAGTGAVSISAKTFINDFANDTVLNLRAGDTTLKAGTYIGTAANPLETDIASLTATADAGGVFIDNFGGLTSLTASAKGSGNDVQISSLGDMVVAKVTAPDAVALTSATGSILRTGSVLNVSGVNVTLQAGGAIGTSAEALIVEGVLNSAIANGGGVFLKGKGALTATTVKSIGGDIEIASERDLTLGLAETDSTHTVKIGSTYGGILDGNAAGVNIRGGTADLTAVKIGTASNAIETDVNSITAVGTSGGIYLDELNAVTVQRLEAQGLGSDISFTAGGNITLGVAKADGDKVSIKSTSGGIADGNGPALNITADQLDISAPGGIGALQNSVNKLGSANGGVGGVTISNIGALAILDSTLEGRGAGKLTIEADSITILDMADNLASLDPNGSLQLTSRTGNIVFLDPNDAIRTSGTGTIGISAGLGITPSYPDTGAVAFIGNLTTAGGAIDVRANHHITIGLLNTGGSGDVTVASETGLIIDGNGATANVIGNTVTLSGKSQDARVAHLESTIRIADYSAMRSEAAAKLTNAQSLATATAIMDVQKNNALGEKDDAIATEAEAERAKDRADASAETAATIQKALEATSIALGLVRNGVEVGAGFAQAIPFSGDGGASGAWAILDLAASIADTAAFFAAIETDRLSGIAEEMANALTQASAELTALTATYNDSLSTWNAFNEATSVAQKAADAAAIARDASLKVRDQAIFAEDQSNVIGTAANPLGIVVQQLHATATDGSVYLSVTGDLALGGISATGTDGVVSVEASGNILVSGVTEAPDQVTLKAGGSINNGGGSIVAPKFLGKAQGSVGSVASPIQTDVDIFAAKANTGTVGVTNNGALEIGSIDGINGVTSAGAVGITSSDSLTFKNTITATGQTVTLLSQNGAIVDAHTGSPEVSALNLNATAATGVSLDTAVTNLTASTTGAGSIEIREADGITLTSVQTANGAISVEAAGTIVATSVVSQTDADANDITLKATANGSIQAGTINAGLNAGDVSFQAEGSLTMLSGGRITADAIAATVGSGIDITTTAKSASLEVTDAGSLTVHESDALVVSQLKTANGLIDLTTGGQITVGEGAVSAGAGLSNITFNAAGPIVGPASGNGAHDILGAIVSLVTTGAGNTIGSSIANPLEVNATTRFNAQTQGSNAFVNDTDGGIVIGAVNTGLGNFHLKALAGSVTAANAGNGIADIVAVHVDLKVTGATSKIGGGETSQLDIDGSTLTVLTEGGDAFLADTAGGVAINTLNVGAGNLFLTATGGAITDNDGGAANNVTATNVMLSATGGVGTDANAIETTATAFEGSGGTGGVNVTDLSGGLAIGGVTSALNGVSATGGNIAITALSPLTVNEAVSNTGSGNVTLTATDSAATGDDLTVNANVSATSGNVTLLAGDSFLLASGRTVSALNGTVDIRGDHGNADAGTGATITLNGAIRAGSLAVTSNGDDDTIIVKDVIAGSTNINTNGGNDDVTIASGNTLGTGTIDAGAGDDKVTISSAVQNILGGSGSDLLLVKAGGSVTGTADGGADSDKLVYDHDGVGSDDFAGPVTVNLQTQSGTALAGLTGFETLEATSNTGDRLIGANATNTWHITGTNSGDIGSAAALSFSGFENLTGGTQDDTFQFAAAGDITGDLKGGGHAVRDTIDYNSLNRNAAVTVTLDGSNGGTASAVGGRIDNIDQIVADTDFSATNSLTGGGANNVWTLTGPNAGNISNQFFFENFGITGGGSADDNFAFADGALPPKPVHGGDGNNTLDLSAWTTDIQWTITADGAGTVTTIAGTFEFTGMDKLIGGSANDRFTFTDNTVLGGGFLAPGMIDGRAGTDFIDMSAYTPRNTWSRVNTEGSIETNRALWNYASIEEYQGSKTTTFLYDVIDLTGTFSNIFMEPKLKPTEGGSVYLTVTNIGNDDALNKHVAIKYYLSLDGKLDGNDVLIGENADRLVNLRPGDTNLHFYTATKVPFGTAPGMYHLLALVDSNHTVSEGDESNNVIDGGNIEVLPIEVDLKPESVGSTLPSQSLPGTKGTLTTTVKNLGNSPVKGKANVEFFLSTDGTIDSGDIALGGLLDQQINLASGASRTFSFNATVPAGTAAGDYQVLVRVDGQDQILESDESNNVAAALSQVHISAPFVDLVGQFENTTLPAIGVPNDILKLKVPVMNVGNIAAVGKIDVDFYLSVDGTVDPGTDVLLKSLQDVQINLGPDGQRYITTTAAIPAILNGTYFVLADIDSTHVLTENHSNNTAILSDGLEVVWRFGSFADRRNVQLVVPDANGNMVTFSMNGKGVGNVLGGSTFSELSLVGTNDKTTVNIKTKGKVSTEIGNITSTNSIGILNASKVNLLGDFSIDGSAKSIVLGDVSGDITIGAAAKATDSVGLKFGHVSDSSITSATPINKLSVIDWLDTDATQDRIEAPWFKTLKSNGAFEADIVANSALAGVSISSLTVKGAITSDVTLAGGIGGLTVGSWTGGTFAAKFAKNVVINGDLSDTELTLSGAGLKTSQQALGTMKVTGGVLDSLIEVRHNVGSVQTGTWGAGSTLAVGVDAGGDGTFFDGNETAIGGKLGQFTSANYDSANGGAAFGIAVDGLLKGIQLNRTTKYAAAGLPATNGDLKLSLI